ncbi:Pyrrolo-quinoline quinone [Rhodopirellula maiorica SM1]|uniref:Pyrrolo-quinoline quinone n=1 Tax=Rhodopirellula maiorica SM1 TaxID=1265738 RepID=M5RB36_9BACT|nr:PQQ-binding-like beta-propeller repeat protein [Rhodopirellula maiorica]EMI16698.1 Pyrrolo-quinoline quinone [Rhodopirellula maiorica SM1]
MGESPLWADWPQWRGANRDGYAESSKLIRDLPAAGLPPVWEFADFEGGNSGGWSSPVIADGKVYVYAHTKSKKEGDALGPAQYPWLSPEKRTGMTDAEYEAYEVRRRDENEARAKAFSFEQRVVCLDLKSGNTIWDKRTPVVYTRFVQSGTPCVADGKLFVLGPERTAYCYDAETGDVIWTARLPGEFRDEFFASSFVVHADVAMVACGALVALDAADGRLLWQGQSPLDYSSHSSPVVWKLGDQQTRADVVIANTQGGRTEAYRIADGTLLWDLQSGAGQSTPIVTHGLLLTYGSSRKNGLSAYRLDAATPDVTPELAWRFRGAADSGSTPAVYRDSVFVQGEKRLAKVRLEDGDTVWQTTLSISNPRYTSLLVAGDLLYFAWDGVLCVDAASDRFRLLFDAEIDSEGRLIKSDDLRNKLNLDAIEADAGGGEAEKVWQKALTFGPLACSTPAISDGVMLVRRRDSLVCYRLEADDGTR